MNANEYLSVKQLQLGRMIMNARMLTTRKIEKTKTGINMKNGIQFT